MLEVRAVQVLGDWLTLLELTRTLAEEVALLRLQHERAVRGLEHAGERQAAAHDVDREARRRLPVAPHREKRGVMAAGRVAVAETVGLEP